MTAQQLIKLALKRAQGKALHALRMAETNQPSESLKLEDGTFSWTEKQIYWNGQCDALEGVLSILESLDIK